MSKFTPILDNGHGGVLNGKYQTQGKRSPNWDKGTLYEGVFNRWIVNGILKELDYLNYPYFHISPELEDTSLNARINRANAVYKYLENPFILSIHANAGRGTGWEIFTSPGETVSDKIAEHFITTMENSMPIPLRSDILDGDRDKEDQFVILTRSKCPAILVECGFMDHRKDYNLLWDRNFHTTLIQSLTKAIISL